MGYMPHPFPGELVSGVVIRTARHLGITVRQVTANLTGRRGRHPPFLLPCFLEAVARETGMDAGRLLVENSLFPYLTAALTESHARRIGETFLKQEFDGRHAMPSTAYLQLPGVKFRRFCEECVVADCDERGESYWHREHQLPALTRCIRHGSPLVESVLKIRTPDAQAALLPSDLAGRCEYVHAIQDVVPDWLIDSSVSALTVPFFLSAFPYVQAADRRGFRWEDAYSRAQLIGAAFAVASLQLSRLIPQHCLCSPSLAVPESARPVPQWPTLVWIVIHHYLAT